jgi:hypothetical protein
MSHIAPIVTPIIIPITLNSKYKINNTNINNSEIDWKFGHIKSNVSGNPLYFLDPEAIFGNPLGNFDIELKYYAEKSELALFINGMILHSTKICNDIDQHNNIYYIQFFL